MEGDKTLKTKKIRDNQRREKRRGILKEYN